MLCHPTPRLAASGVKAMIFGLEQALSQPSCLKDTQRWIRKDRKWGSRMDTGRRFSFETEVERQAVMPGFASRFVVVV